MVWEWVSDKKIWNLSRDLTEGLAISIYCIETNILAILTVIDLELTTM